MFSVLHFTLFIFLVPFIILVCTFRNCRYLPELGYAISDTKLLRLFPTVQNLPKNPLRFYISLEIGTIEYAWVLNKEGLGYKDWQQTSSQCHFCGQEPFGCSTERLATFPALRVYRHTDGYSLKGWLLWKRSGTPAVGVPSLAQRHGGSHVVFSSWLPLPVLHILPSNTSAFRCLEQTLCHIGHTFLSLAYLRYLWVQQSFRCTSPQVNSCQQWTIIVAFRHDVAFIKSGWESVVCRNPSETLVNSVHDVAKNKPRKFPAVEIRCKFIENFRSNQKHALKC